MSLQCFLICHRGIFFCFVFTEKRVYDFYQGADWHAADKQRRKNAKVFFAAVLRITVNYSFHSSNFFRGHVHMVIRWRDFTGANPSKPTSLLICLYPTIHFF